MTPEAVAVLDCGSNSTRLLIAAGDHVVAREMTITRLSQGVDASGSLSEESIARTLATLARYRSLCDDAGVTRGLLVATSAVRDASNGASFLARARDVSGVEARTLSGEEEAAFSYAGATADLEAASWPTAIVDIGGGSTELALAHGDELVSYSMQLGCVRVTERALGYGPLDDAHADAARLMIEQELGEAFRAVGAFAAVHAQVRLVGLAGTVSTLAQLDAGVSRYSRDLVHHRVLARTCVRDWRDRLGRETPAERLAHPGMVVGREDVLVAGLFILDAVMERFGVEELLSSENDILDGVAASLTGT